MESLPSDIAVADGGAESEEADVRESKQLQFLPKVVLDIVIQKLEEPKEVRSLLEAFPLIDQVVDVGKSCKLLFDEVFPMLFKDLDKKDVLNCRAVCKWWKKSVDKFVEDHPSQHPYDSKTFSQVETGYRYADLKSKDMKAVVIRHPEGFHEKIRYVRERRDLGLRLPSMVGKSIKFLPNQHQAPFNEIRRNWTKYDGFEAPLKDYYNDLVDFLAKFGSDIRHASIPLTGQQFYCSTYVDHYEGFQRCLQLLPSLKSLFLGVHSRFIVVTSCEAAYSEAKEKLANYMSAFPLPEMPNLKTLTVIGRRCRRLEPLDEILVALLKKFSKQIRSLTVGLRILMREDCDLDFENLVELELVWQWSKKRITNLKTPRLEKLILNSSYRNESLVLKEAFEACEVLPVKVLKIVGNPVFQDPKFFPSPTDNLPILKNVTAFVLHQRHISREDSFCFLKSLPMLEYLEIRKKYNMFSEYEDLTIDLNDEEEGEEDDYEEEDEDEGIGENELLDPDGLQVAPNGEKMVVWELLSKLKMFAVGEKRFPREFYYKK